MADGFGDSDPIETLSEVSNVVYMRMHLYSVDAHVLVLVGKDSSSANTHAFCACMHPYTHIHIHTNTQTLNQIGDLPKLVTRGAYRCIHIHTYKKT
jgi:hypothetical protein